MAASLQAITVAGPSLTLGTDVLIFEHLLFDHTSRLQPPQTAEASNIRDEEITLGRLAVIRQHALGSLVNLKSPPADVIVRELTALRAGRPPFTGCTVIDASCHGSGRDLAGLRALSEASGVNIVASAGISADAASAFAEEPEELANKLVEELTKGVEVPGRFVEPIRCGVLALGDGIYSQNTKARTILLQGVGEAQRRTGAPLLIALPANPPPSGTPASSQMTSAVGAIVELIETYGARPDGIIVCHAQNLWSSHQTQSVYTDQLLRLGVTLCVDGLGCDWMRAGAYDLVASRDGEDVSMDVSDSNQHQLHALEDESEPPSESLLAETVARLASRNYAPQIMLSHGISTRLQFESYGGGGLSHIKRVFLPKLQKRGLSPEHATLLLSGNACKALAWWTPGGPAPRVCKVWTCYSCHRSFEEALNPAEALPTDQMYYEKFEYRYCSTHCLGGHRKAGFKAGFRCEPPAS